MNKIRMNAVPHCVCFNLRRAARLMTQRYDAALAPLDLRATQFTLLTHLTFGDRTVGELAAALGLDRTTLTRNLRPLENVGLLAIHAGRDRRERVIRITRRGRRRYEAALPMWQEVQAAVVKKLGPGGLDRLLAATRAADRAAAG